MKSDKSIRSHIAALLTSKHAHVDFGAAVKGVPPRFRGVRPPGLPYSAWQLLEHIRLAQRDIYDFCVNPDYRAPKWPEDYWPESPIPPTSKAWQQSIIDFRADLRCVNRLLADPAIDLTAEIPHGQGQTYMREFLLIADHTAFHVGELVVVRRLLGIWE